MVKFSEWIVVPANNNTRRGAFTSGADLSGRSSALSSQATQQPSKPISVRAMLQSRGGCTTAGSTTASVARAANDSRAASEMSAVGAPSGIVTALSTQQQRRQPAPAGTRRGRSDNRRGGSDDEDDVDATAVANGDSPSAKEKREPKTFRLHNGGVVKLLDAESAFQHGDGGDNGGGSLADALPMFPGASFSHLLGARSGTGVSSLSSTQQQQQQQQHPDAAPLRVFGFASQTSRNALAAAFVQSHRALSQSRRGGAAVSFPSCSALKQESFSAPVSQQPQQAGANSALARTHLLPKSRILVVSPAPCSVVAESIVASGVAQSKQQLFDRTDFVACSSAIQMLQLLEALVLRDLSVKKRVFQQQSGSTRNSASSLSTPLFAAAATSAAENTVPPPAVAAGAAPPIDLLPPIALVLDRVDQIEPLSRNLKAANTTTLVSASGACVVSPASMSKAASNSATTAAAAAASKAATTQHAVTSNDPAVRWGPLRDVLVRGLDCGAFCSVSVTATAFPSSNSLLTAASTSNDNGFSSLGGGGSFYQSGYQQRSSFGGSGAPVPAALSALVDMFLVVPQQL